jgi:3-dehydroquinate synthase
MASHKIEHELDIVCSSHQYPILIGHGLLEDHQKLRAYVKGSQVMIVTNDTLAPLYLKSVQQAFSSLQCNTVVLPDGEPHKNLNSLSHIYDALIHHQHHRDTTLIALGGGVIGDITGFAAATYQRGVRFIQLPTTLLAQVDASVGGKTAVNHPLGKNMIGSFHQPDAVIMDLNTLETLPEREFNAGLAEVIKYALLMGGDCLLLLEQVLQVGFASKSSKALADLIAHCCGIKAKFVEEDEREQGRRALLNLGHTFGHALESYTQYERWLHGEAVAMGLYCAALLSKQLGYLTQADLQRLDLMLKAAQLPSRIPKDIDLKQIQALMLKDKKVKNKQLHVVLIRAWGDCYIESTLSDAMILQALMGAVDGE